MALTTEGMEGSFEDWHSELMGSFFAELSTQTRRQDELIELHERYVFGDIDEVSISVRTGILELLRAIECDEITFDDPSLRSDTLKQLWGKIAYLNGQLELKHPETAYRYGNLKDPTEEVRNVLNIRKT